jgi:hypothetical protein
MGNPTFDELKIITLHAIERSQLAVEALSMIGAALLENPEIPINPREKRIATLLEHYCGALVANTDSVVKKSNALMERLKGV